MKDFIALLVEQSRLKNIAINPGLDDALTRLDHALASLCEAVQVEYRGPYVGVETLLAHQMVVRRHEWKIHQPAWSLKICVAAAPANYRAEWPIQGVSRLRKALVVKALPEFFAGFAQTITSAGKDGTAVGQRVLELSRRFNA